MVTSVTHLFSQHLALKYRAGGS